MRAIYLGPECFTGNAAYCAARTVFGSENSTTQPRYSNHMGILPLRSVLLVSRQKDGDKPAVDTVELVAIFDDAQMLIERSTLSRSLEVGGH